MTFPNLKMVSGRAERVLKERMSNNYLDIGGAIASERKE